MDNSRLVQMIFLFSLSLYLCFSVFSKFSTVGIFCFSNKLTYFNQMRYTLTFLKDKFPHSFVEEVCFEQDSQWKQCCHLAERRGCSAQRATVNEDCFIGSIIGWPTLQHVRTYGISIHCSFPIKDNAKTNLYFIMMIPIAMFAHTRYFANIFSLIDC